MGLFETLLLCKVLKITDRLLEWMKEDEFELITSEHQFFDANKIIMYTDSGATGEFILNYVKAIRRKLKCEWFLSNEHYKESLAECPRLLIGKLPWNHYVLLAPATPVKKET